MANSLAVWSRHWVVHRTGDNPGDNSVGKVPRAAAPAATITTRPSPNRWFRAAAVHPPPRLLPQAAHIPEIIQRLHERLCKAMALLRQGQAEQLSPFCCAIYRTYRTRLPISGGKTSAFAKSAPARA